MSFAFTDRSGKSAAGIIAPRHRGGGLMKRFPFRRFRRLARIVAELRGLVLSGLGKESTMTCCVDQHRRSIATFSLPLARPLWSIPPPRSFMKQKLGAPTQWK